MPEQTLFPDGATASPHLFIVRIWYESPQLARPPWRGSVEHVPSGQRLYFASLGDLNDFITLRLNGRRASEGGEPRR